MIIAVRGSSTGSMVPPSKGGVRNETVNATSPGSRSIGTSRYQAAARTPAPCGSSRTDVSVTGLRRSRSRLSPEHLERLTAEQCLGAK